jgi:hypothetical protein
MLNKRHSSIHIIRSLKPLDDSTVELPTETTLKPTQTVVQKNQPGPFSVREVTQTTSIENV